MKLRAALLICTAFIMPVPKNRNTRDENRTIKNGEVPFYKLGLR